MDFSSLRDQVSNLTLYDLKAGVRKVQNAVMNFTEMEAKVREATNNEPWGASSTLMQEIANGTHSYQTLNEIMPIIYKRFTEKSAEEWRQIYKALQLLEFLIKNGSERVVDDARSHISLIRMLRQFAYIDDNGKDQGINVRNRSQELTKLLGDVEVIRAERKKARANRHKFGGFEGGSGFGSGMGSGRYGGFGNDSGFGGYAGGVFGDGGGFGGGTSDWGDVGRRANRFEEYDEGDDPSYREQPPPPPPAKREVKKPEPQVDLFDFGDDPLPTSMPATIPPPSASAGKQATNISSNNDDDDFDDFQTAPNVSTTPAPAPAPVPASTFSISSFSSTPAATAPKPASGVQSTDLNSLLSSTSFSSLSTPNYNFKQGQPSFQQVFTAQPPRPTGHQPSTPNYFTSVPAPPTMSPISPLTTGASSSSLSASNNAAAKKKASGDVFGSLWSTASANAGIKAPSAQTPKGPALSSMAKEKASAGIWGGSSGSSTPMNASTPMSASTPMNASKSQHSPYKTTGPSVGHGLDDLLG